MHSKYAGNVDSSYHGWLKGQKVREGGSKTVPAGRGEASAWPAQGELPWFLGIYRFEVLPHFERGLLASGD